MPVRKNTSLHSPNHKPALLINARQLNKKLMSLLDANESLLLGIEIGGTKLQLVAGTSPACIIGRQRLFVNPSAGADTIWQHIQIALAKWTGIRWRAVGIGFGGLVNWRSGRIFCSHQIQGWDDLNLRDRLEGLACAPVAVENDANLASLAEARYGAGAGFNQVFYTNSGSGVGGGFVVDGHIYHGATPGEMEFGHLRLSPEGATVEQRCSGWAVDQKVRNACSKEPFSNLAELAASAPGSEARHLACALSRQDPVAIAILEETAGDLAFSLSHVAHLLHPEVIVLGGGLALLGEPWRTAVARALPNHLMAAFHPGPQVRLAALAEDVVPVGALALASSLCLKETKVPEVFPSSKP
jgi:glucokinase